MIRRFRSGVISALVVGVLGAPSGAGATEAEPIRVVVMNVGASDASLQSLANALAEQILTELSRTKRIEAMGTSDVSAVLGLERQKALLGCADQGTSCLAEISAAMGAPYLVTGHLARAGKATRIDIKLIRASDGKALHRDGRNFRDESEMFDLVGGMVKSLVAELKLPDEVTPAAQAKPSSAKQPLDAPLAAAGGQRAVTSTKSSEVPHPEGLPPTASPVPTMPTHQGSTNPYLLPLGLGIGGGLLSIAGAVTWGASFARAKAEEQSWRSQVEQGELLTVAQIRAAERAVNEPIAVGIVLTGVGVAVVGTGMGLLYKRLSTPAPTTSMTVSAVPVGAEGGMLVLGGTL